MKHTPIPHTHTHTHPHTHQPTHPYLGAGELGKDFEGEFLTQFYAPLVVRVEIPYHCIGVVCGCVLYVGSWVCVVCGFVGVVTGCVSYELRFYTTASAWFVGVCCMWVRGCGDLLCLVRVEIPYHCIQI